MSDHERLFDADAFRAGPAVGGESPVEWAEYLEDRRLGVCEFYRICLLPSVTRIFVPGSDNAEVQNGDNDNGYAFKGWTERAYDHSHPIEGFLWGFPILRKQDGSTMPAVHVHYQWENATDSSTVVPLADVEEVYMYDPIYSQLRASQDDLMGNFNGSAGSRRFKVPLLFDDKTQEWIMKPATAEDLGEAIKELDLPPTQIFGSGWLSTNPTKPQKFKFKDV